MVLWYYESKGEKLVQKEKDIEWPKKFRIDQGDTSVEYGQQSFS